MKRLLSLLCALSAAAVMCACQDVPVDSELAATEATDLTTEETSLVTEASTDLTGSIAETTDEETSESTSQEQTLEQTTEAVSVNEDSIRNLQYSTWTQANANAKYQIAERILKYIESQKGEVSMESSELIAGLNSLDSASDTDSLLSLSYGVLGIEE